MQGVCLWTLLLLLLSIDICAAKGNHLFSSGASALSWDSDELTRVRELHNRSFNDPQKFSSSENLAAYLGLSSVDGIHLPIPVNVLLIGFNKDGKAGVQIHPSELEEWFGTLDHVLPHTRVPLHELSCKEDGYCVDFEAVRKPQPLHSYVHYNVSVHAVEVTSALSVQFASALKALSRADISATEDTPRQVDVSELESVVDGMLAELGILWSYNVLLINPDIQEPMVYRAGFSKKEIDHLTKSEDVLTLLRKGSELYRTSLQSVPGSMNIHKRWHPMRNPEPFDVNRLMAESGRWSYQMQAWLAHREKTKQRLQTAYKQVEEFISMKGIHGDSPLTELIDVLVKNEQHRSDLTGAHGMRVLEPEEGCAMDMWTGHRRWILMDLTAKPQDWGPLVGGDGVKTRTTLPSIDAYFLKKPEFDSKTDSSRLKDKLRTDREKRFEELHDYRIEGDVPKEVLRETELELLQRFNSEHCLHSDQPPVMCQKVTEAISKLKKKENLFLSRHGEDLFMEWFGMDEDVNEAEMEHEGRMKDLFLAHASALVSRAVRHVFIPPTLTWKHDDSADADVSTPYAQSITFRVYLMTDIPRDPRIRRSPFDTANLKKELMGLKLEKQDFQFVVQHQNIIDDAILSTSLASSLRSSTLEYLESETSFQSEERLYFDSEDLRLLLSKRLFGGGTPRKKTVVGREHVHLDVPIFILILDRDRPVFIDRHYIARATEDMVIVVQNSQHRGQHPLGVTCGEGIIGQTLAAPLKATLAAVLQHLGGLLPPHLGYSPEHRAIAHDWTWSIGTNPFSFTSPGWKISQAQKDALHRTYILDSVDLSVEMVNHGIRLLQSITPTDHPFEFVQKESSTLVSMLKDFALLVELWRRTVSDSGNMEFERAMTKLSAIQSAAQRFMNAAEALEHGARPLRCRNTTSTFVGPSWLSDEIVGGCLLIAVCVVLYSLLPKRGKPKRS